MDADERFVLAVDSKKGEAYWMHHPHISWRKITDRDNTKVWLMIELLQEQLRSLDLEKNDLSAEDIIGNIMKGLQDEL